MKREKFLSLLKEKVLFLDGAYGTEFIKMGCNERLCEILNIKEPFKVEELQNRYIKVGADLLLTNTFSANRFKLESFGLADNIEIINYSAVKIAKKVATKSLVFGDIGPTGTQIEPFGNLSFDNAYEIFKEQAKILINSGVDGIILETFSDIKELKSAIFAIRDIDQDIPLIAQMTFLKDGRTISGTSIEIFATVINDLDVDVAGINCSLNPQQILPLFGQLASFCNKPLSIEPNAGNPIFTNGKLIYDMDPVEFAIYFKSFVDLGANIIGGCCGTTAEHIKTIVEFIGKKKPKEREFNTKQYLSSRTELKDVEPFLIIGEKINASAKKGLQSQIEQNNFNKIIELAHKQAREGALCIDINPGIEKLLTDENIKNLIINLDKHCSLPLSLDIQDLHLIEIVIKEYPARALINSSKADEKSLIEHLSMIKKYGGMLVVLAMKDEASDSYSKRINIIKEAVQIINSFNIDLNRIFFDPLILPIASGYDYEVPLRTIDFLCKKKMKSIIGLSNLTFGMPEREKINSFFLSLAMDKGLSAAILDTSHQMTMNIIQADLILTKNELKNTLQENEDPLVQIIINGEKDLLIDFVDKKLKEEEPIKIINDTLTKTMEKIGGLYSEGKIFLPHLILASETVQVAFDYLSSLIKEEKKRYKGKILLATVAGDIHDIGKKIVATVLKSFGYEVIDIGKNIDSQTILRKVKIEKPDILGLSAMMTTTLNEIDEVATLLRENNLNIPIIAGGASMNEKIASEYSVFYAKDAFDAIEIIEKIILSKKKKVKDKEDEIDR
jgi:5-methyltetrahydrofolate--homocysteine methyltransferase